MEHVEYVYTVGMTDAEVDEYLRTGEHGVLGLADADDAYAVPLSYHYDGTRFLLRVSHHDDDSDKRQYLETTDTATFISFDASMADSWSIQVRGPIAPWDEDVDEATLDGWFPPFRLFDEAVDDVEFTLYELRMESVVGRRTVE
ncbi:pyridoxamine 5'-phosphate oxidase family protein [Natronomonas amylolytica]|uniref:pyridoxamine 5'-phosphate oxidase family protein n=1 Tax=Natronomonas amylolytica TaxID=3108498 RepID=UPI003008B919